MHTELIDTMGDDLRVVNAARVSFDKESDWGVHELTSEYGPTVEVNELKEADVRLLTYLAKHNHWTPFSHVMITMRETVPIFVARQRFKHMVGFTYNEVSRRYVDTPPEFFVPDEWRGKPVNAKQGSSDEVLETLMDDIYHRLPDGQRTNDVKKIYESYIVGIYNAYLDLVAGGVAPEQARMVLPQSMYTSYYTTGSLAAWARAYKLRSDEHSQKEIRDLADQWNTIIRGIPELKYSWSALVD